MATAMTPDLMVSTFESMIDDTMDSTLEYALLNEVKDTFESSRDWNYLLRVDTSQSANAGDTYLTMKTLPTDFVRVPGKGYIYVGTDILPYIPIPFQSRIRWQSIAHRYYVDYYNKQYAIAGQPNPGGTINFYYQAASPTLSTGGSTWIADARYHILLPYKMARKYFAIDQGEKSRAWDDRWDLFAKELEDSMIFEDTQRMKNALMNDVQGADLSTYPNIVDIDSQPGGAQIYA